MLKEILKKFIPAPLLSAYHYSLARLAALLYGHPSEQLIVIGITGTNGKSTTTQYLGRILESAGAKVGWTSTAGFKVGKKEWENEKKMTMLGRFQTQKILKQMVEAGCQYAIVETSSQGIAQYRHIGINYDIAVFTNLTPEHIEAHGGFENYKKAKGKLFSHTAAGKRKQFGAEKVEKVSIVNIDDEHAPFFLSFKADRKIGYGTAEDAASAHKHKFEPMIAKGVKVKKDGSSFMLSGMEFSMRPLGDFNVRNMIAAVASARALGFDLAEVKKGVASIKSVPGRLESIDEGQNFSVIVDYAYEPAALTAVYDTLKLIGHKRLIHVTGSAGGGRDVARRKVLGKMAAKHDDIVIVANEDPYDEDPMQIIDDVADAAEKAGKKEGKTLFRILDRQKAIEKAVELAHAGDLVLITGKGSEPVMAVEHGKKIPWDDRKAARKALAKL